jgi:hypothetical protein
MISDHAVGIAWALLVCGAGLLSVALTQPRRDHGDSRQAQMRTSTHSSLAVWREQSKHANRDPVPPVRARRFR